MKQKLSDLSYDTLLGKLVRTNETIKYIEQTPAHARSQTQKDVLRELRADRNDLRRACQAHPDRPVQMDFLNYPARSVVRPT